MIPEPLQEQASLYVLGTLTPAEQGIFETRLREDGELRDLVFNLQRMAELMAKSVVPATPPARLKGKILERIAHTNAVPPSPPRPMLPGLRFHESAGESGWKALPLPGAFIKILSIEKDRGYAVMLGKIEAGVCYPAHVNVGPEDFYILSGDLVVGDRVLRAGDFHHADKGSQHEVNYSKHGCTLLAVLTVEDPLVAFAMS